MRYVELNDGHVILAPRRAHSHSEMIRMCGVRPPQVRSAGFVSLGYGEEDAIKTWGDSVNLEVQSRPGVVIPRMLWGAVRGLALVFSSNPAHLDGLANIEQAKWGMTPPSPWGEAMPVYAPLHSAGKKHAADYIMD